jgi:hypothetical protein
VTIKTDNSAVIAGLLERIAGLELQLKQTLDSAITQASALHDRVAELEKESKKLEKPAMVGAGIFREGVHEKLVIESAQRHYERETSKALKELNRG